MKPKFTICRLGAQAKVPNVDTIIQSSDLDNICKRLIGYTTYDVKWIDDRIKGKMFTLETDAQKFYITYTPREVRGRKRRLL